MNAIDKTVFPLKDFMPIGFSFMDKLRYGYNNKFDRDLRKKLLELHEEEFNEFYLRVYWAAAASYFWLGLLITALFYLATNDIIWFGIGIAVTVVLVYSAFADIQKKNR